ncbi:MAG: hypothetical protein EAZ26_13500 [Runella slithyformis]|nr:MAG: hypothetical protein EAZ26_13500 [Runella slithyformis]
MLIVQGTINAGVTLEEANAAVEEVLQELAENGVAESELAKVKNQAESTLVFSEIELLNRAMSLAYAANAGNANWVNQETAKIVNVTTQQVQQMAQTVLAKQNCSTLFYRAVN